MKTSVENQLLSGRPSREDYVAPEVNIFEAKDGYVLEAEMPGVDKGGLEITLEGNEIKIIGRPKTAVPSGSPLLRERHTAAFRRLFELDPAIDTSRIVAKIEQGLLSLELPKSERVKPRKITVD